MARPFFNASTGQPTSELVGFLPSVGKSLSGSRAVCGAVHAELDSEFQGAGFWLRRNYSSSLDCCGNGYRLDTLLGYRFLKLDESIWIRERLTSLDPSVPNTAFEIMDQFGTRNEFHGLDFGLLWTGRRNRLRRCQPGGSFRKRRGSWAIHRHRRPFASQTVTP